MRVPARVHPVLLRAALPVLLLPAASAAQVGLNEVLPAPAADWNQNGIPSSSEDEWIEIFNGGSEPVGVSGWFVADATGTPRVGLEGDLAPGEHLFLTGELAADWEALNGYPAVGLSLNNSGDTVTLFRVASAETTVVDSLAYTGSEVDPDVSLGRLPDGTGGWIVCDALAPGGTGPQPTPGGANGGPASPKILAAGVQPSFPTSDDPLVVSALAGDADGIAECRLLATIDGGAHPVVLMTLVDGTVERGTWETTLSAQPAGTVLSLVVQVSDGTLLEQTNPFEITVAGADAPVVLNEILADPPPDLAGDANGDGVRGTSDDEFVEIVNRSGTPVDLAGWRLEDASGIRHEFVGGPTLEPGALWVVFGGGDPTGIPSGWDVATSGGLSLNNSGDEVRLVGPDDVPRDVHAYGSEGGADQSLIRLPDGDGEWTRPGDAGFGWAFSPGVLNETATSVTARSWAKVKSLYRD
jgi:hypothetical protein